MGVFGQLVAILIALVLVSGFLLSVARSTLLNGRRRDPVLNAVARLVHAIIKFLARNRSSDEDVARIIQWYLPLFTFFMIVTWFVVVMVGFAFMYWESGAETTYFDSLISSGSALSTLGFDTPSTSQGKVIAVVEGAFGLMIVIFFFSFIPGYQSAAQARDSRAAWLYARVGPMPTGVEVLLWYLQNTVDRTHDDFWAAWEDWFLQIRLTHVAKPEVIYTPSSIPNQSWVICSQSILDAAALYIAAIEEKPDSALHACMTGGAGAVCDVSASIGFRPDRQSDRSALLTEAQFAAGLDLLRAADIDVKRSGPEAWTQFSELRSTYEAPLHHIAQQTLLRAYPGFLPVPTP